MLKVAPYVEGTFVCLFCFGFVCLFVFSSGYWCFTPQSRKSTGANSAGQEISDNVLPHGGVLGRVCSPLHSLWSTCWCLFLLKDISFSPILSKPLPHTPQTAFLVVGYAIAQAPLKTTGKANKLCHVCRKPFNCFATAIQAKRFKRFMSNIFPPG